MKRSRRTVRAVSHAVHLLRELAGPRPDQSLTDLAAAIGLSTTSTYHLLSTLSDEGLVAHRPGSGYTLGWGLFELGTAVSAARSLRTAARLEMDRLASVTNAVVLLAVLDDTDVVYLDRGDGSGVVGSVANVGRRARAHITASGKLLAAFAPVAIQERLLTGPLPAATTNTITDPTKLRSELARIRRRGYATSWEEGEPGINSLAVPIRGATGTVLAAVNLTAPARRLTQRSLRAHRDVLMMCSERISVAMGFTPGRDEG